MKSVKLVKLIMVLLGLFLIIKSGTFDELSSQDPDTMNFVLGVFLVLVAFLRKIRLTVKELI